MMRSSRLSKDSRWSHRKLQKLLLTFQVGFAPGQLTAHNLDTLFSLLHQLRHSFSAVAVVSGTEKALDSLEWSLFVCSTAQIQSWLYPGLA